MSEILKQIQSAYLMGDSTAIFNMLPDLIDSVGKTVFELPCKVGDTVYFIKSMFTLLGKPQDCQIENWSMYANGTIKFVAKYKDVYEKIFYEDCFGKTVFLTEQAAKAELEKRTASEKT